MAVSLWGVSNVLRRTCRIIIADYPRSHWSLRCRVRVRFSNMVCTSCGTRARTRLSSLLYQGMKYLMTWNQLLQFFLRHLPNQRLVITRLGRPRGRLRQGWRARGATLVALLAKPRQSVGLLTSTSSSWGTSAAAVSYPVTSTPPKRSFCQVTMSDDEWLQFQQFRKKTWLLCHRTVTSTFFSLDCRDGSPAGQPMVWRLSLLWQILSSIFL